MILFGDLPPQETLHLFPLPPNTGSSSYLPLSHLLAFFKVCIRLCLIVFGMGKNNLNEKDMFAVYGK